MRHRPTDRARSGGIEPEVVRVRLLGGFGVSVGSRTVEDGEWRRRKARSMIKLLALAPGHRLHKEQVLAVLWPELDTKPAANNLHRVLRFAREAFEPDASTATFRYLMFQGDMLVLCPEGPIWVDVEVFEDAAVTARSSRELAACRAAVELYAGELLPEDRYEEWAQERRTSLRETYLGLLVRLGGLHEDRSEYAPAIEVLRLALVEDPAREEAHRGLMRLYAASGDRQLAIAQYALLEKALSKQLRIGPSVESRGLYEQILANRYRSRNVSRPSKGPTSKAHNLPNSRTSFVGREKEMIGVRRSLAMTSLLTITGAGGSGKTRLALEVARDLVGAYPDGVWLVELAPLSDPMLVSQTMAAALGMREQPGLSLTRTLTNHLRARQALLVLDNCEHLIDACARLVDALLDACPKLRILATSREALGVAGETSWPLSTLSLPGADEEGSVPNYLTRYGAVRLFVERARSRLPDFELTGENALGVVEACRKLDGIPLAIELATARLSALAIEQIATRLNDSLKLLNAGGRIAVPRHKTLRATLDWSHDLLNEPEVTLFARLSTFAGGWTLEAAEEVCSGGGIERDEVLDLLSKLVDKSLVVAETGGAPRRYRMLEPVRQYGQEKLEESGEADRVRERHAEYYLALAEEAHAGETELTELRLGRPVAWLKRMESDHANLRAALDWSIDEESDPSHAELGLRLAIVLWWFWHARDHQSEGRRYLEKATSTTSRDPTTSRLRAWALDGAAELALFQGDSGTSKALVEESLALYRELGDKEGIARGLTGLGYAAVVGQLDDVPLPEVFEELMELKPELKNRNTLAYLLILEGIMALVQGDAERSVALHEESLGLFRGIGDLQGMTVCLCHLGLLGWIQGDYERASLPLRESLRLASEADYKVPIQVSLYGLAGVAASRGQPVRAARLWGASVEGMQEDFGVHLAPATLSVTDYEGHLSTTISRLGEEAFAAAWAEGKAMPLEQIVEYALSTHEPSAPATSSQRRRETQTQAPPDGLTPREIEVAVLVGRGLSNRRIAGELGISERTVETHVGRILKKLGFRSRARIAARAMDLGLLVEGPE